ncbi:MAG: cytochrome C [Desulfurivibrio sp.]|nr:MAG: cytochrome C [Desulfurivibrio sp.]
MHPDSKTMKPFSAGSAAAGRGRRALAFFLHVLALLSVLGLMAPDCRADNCLANGCHGEIKGKPVVHAPVDGDDCLSCHRQVNQQHPSAAGQDFAAAAEGGALCFQCHAQEGFNGRRKHGPSASGACTVCHDPHGSDQQGLLKMPLKELCLDCHQDFAASMEEAAYLHTAIRKLDCGACHLPHSSDQPSLLKGDSINLCFGCHENIKNRYDTSLDKHKALYVRQRCGNCHFAHYSPYPALLVKQGADLCFDCHGQDESGRSDAPANIRAEIEGKEVVHGPVAEGECSACHEVHGSNFAMLLSGPFPRTFYAPYQPDAYDFCFQCHDKELLTAQPVNNQTGFRNGTDNLHFRHVARKQKGRTCLACHSVHASNGQKLINPEGIAFGKWQIPIRFAATETGGGCVPGCHRSLDYDRQTPFDYTKPSAAKQAAETPAAGQNSSPPAAAGDSDALAVEPLDTEQGTP